MRFLLAAAATALLAAQAHAQDVLKLAIGQRGVWENSTSELGQDAGFFARHGLKLEILYTEGGGQTQQAVISGSVDIGIGVGTYGVLGAFSKNAPVRIIGNSMVGANDLYWYVPSASPIKGMKDAGDKSVAFSTTGSSTDLIVRGFAKTYDVKLNPVATGSPPSTFTQVMSGQVDVGWSSPPLGLDALAAGRIRIVGRGGEVPGFDTQSVRVMIANAGTLARRADVVARYMLAYREALDWQYNGDESLAPYARWAGVSLDLARQTRDEFHPKANQLPDRVIGLEQEMPDAVAFKFLSAPLTTEQLSRLVQVPKP